MLINMESWICLYVLYCFLKAANIGRECRMQYTAVTNDFTHESLYSVMVKIVSIIFMPVNTASYVFCHTSTCLVEFVTALYCTTDDQCHDQPLVTTWTLLLPRQSILDIEKSTSIVQPLVIRNWFCFKVLCVCINAESVIM